MSATTERHLLTPAETAQAFGVNVKTLTRWANSGKLSSVRTLGGHRRFLEDEVAALLNQTRRDKK